MTALDTAGYIHDRTNAKCATPARAERVRFPSPRDGPRGKAVRIRRIVAVAVIPTPFFGVVISTRRPRAVRPG